MLSSLFSFIQSITSFSEESYDIIQPVLKEMDFKKRDYLLKEGEVSNSIFFIEKGYCRTYYNKDGKDINTGFFFENDFVTNLNSLTKREKSQYNIQACEALWVVKLDRTKLLEAYTKSQQIETLGRKLLEKMMGNHEWHSDMFKLLTSQERYEYLEKHQPQMVQRVTLTQMASYIGVSRETLSRIRNKRIKRTIM